MQSKFKHTQTFCAGCPLYRDTKHNYTYVPTTLRYRDFQEDGKTPQIDLLIISGAPGKDEDERGESLIGEAGNEVFTALRKHNIEESFGFLNILRCRPFDGEKNRKPTIEEIAACRNYAKKDIELFKPKIIILMGDLAVQSLLPNPNWAKKNVNILKGEVYTEGDYTYVVTIHPYTFIKSKSYMERKRFQDHIGIARRLLTGEQTKWSRKGSSTLLTTKAEVKDLVDLIKTMPVNAYDTIPGIGLDVETRNLNRVAFNEMLTIQFAVDNNVGFVLPLFHPESPFLGNIDDIIKMLFDLFSYDAPFYYWLAHHGKFDLWQSLRFFGLIKFKKPVLDTLYLEYLLDENQRTSDSDIEGISSFSNFDLKTLSREKLDFHHYDPYILEVRKKPDGFYHEPLYENGHISKFTDYAGMDAYTGRRLGCVQITELKDQGYDVDALRLAQKWDARVTHLYTKMEANGLFTDKDQVTFLGGGESPILERLKEIPKEILSTPEGKKANWMCLQQDSKTSGMKPLFGKAQTVWSIRKPKHKKNLLVDACELEPLEYSEKTGASSLGKTYYAYYEGHPIVDLVSEYTKLDKLYTSYITSVGEILEKYEDNKIDGRIRANFSSTKTVTGRGATSDPNTSQLPSASNHAKAMIKSMYGASLDHIIIESDYGQSEVRWWAQLSDDEKFAKLFWDMKKKRDEYLRNPTPELAKEVSLFCDIHKQSAALMYQINIEDVTKVQRQATKAFVFGSMYGKHYTSLARDLKIKDEEALDIQNTFLTKFEKAGNWLFEIERFAEKYKYVVSPYGRRRHLEPLFIKNPNAAKRRARNSPIQSASSDTMFLSAWRFQDWLENEGLHQLVRIVNTIHDAVLFEMPLNDTKFIYDICMKLQDIMCNFKDFVYKEFGIVMKVPFESDFKMGLRWGHCIEWNGLYSHLEEILEQCRDWNKQIKDGKPWYKIATEIHEEKMKKAA